MEQYKNELIEVGKLLYQKNYITGTEGNLSIRISREEILTTRSGVCKGSMSSDDLVLVNHVGDTIGSDLTPSTEFKMHLEVYKNRPEINAIVHAHPEFVISLSLAGINFDKQYLPESALMLGKVPIAKYARPSTAQVPKSIKPYLQKTDIIILEKTAKIIWLASRISPLIPLDPLEIKELLKLRSAVYGLDSPIP